MSVGVSKPSLETDGFAIVPAMLSAAVQQALASAFGGVTGPGQRGVLRIPEIKQVAGSRRFLDLVEPYLPGVPRPVRAIYFDKSPKANWLVSWHQDLTVAVRQRLDVPGFGPWSMKDGLPHVQPPVEILDCMLTLRLHLDHCDETNGALRVLRGTHRLGRLSAERIQELRHNVPEMVCRVSAGDVLLMRPLLLHASGKSQGRGHRRVLHIEYAGSELPGGLEWYEAVVRPAKQSRKEKAQSAETAPNRKQN